MFKKKEILSKRLLLPFKSSSPIANNEAKTNQLKLRDARRSYAKERTKQREHLNQEVASMDKLLEENSIDKNTHARYKKLVEMGYVKKRQETREKYGFSN